MNYYLFIIVGYLVIKKEFLTDMWETLLLRTNTSIFFYSPFKG